MKLYNKAKTGKIVEWDCEIEGAQFRTITGQLGGKLIVSAWTTCKGKNIGKSNETSPQVQALKEVIAKTIKKKEEGYVEHISELDGREAGEQEIVMLAEKWKDFQEDIPEDEVLYVQGKLDGIRSKSENYTMVSRKNKSFVGVPHIQEELKRMHVLLTLDGELYNHDLKFDFNAIVSIVKKSKPTEEDLIVSERIMQYHVYDCMIPGGFAARYAKLEELFARNNFKYLKLVKAYPILKSQVNEYHDKFVAEGYEGIIIRRDTEYEYFRSQNLLKLKHWIDEEFEIVDVEEGVGNRSGMMGRFILKAKNGQLFGANAKGSFDKYKEWWNNKHLYIGQQATLKYQNLTPAGIPRFGNVITIRDYE